MDVEIEMRPALPEETMWGSLGGTLNLWVGVSFVTAIELFELCYNLVMKKIVRVQKQTVKREPNQDNNVGPKDMQIE